MNMHDAQLPSPPFVTIDGIHNFRDAGGYPVALHPDSNQNPQSVRRGLLYRCADPSRVTKSGKAKIQSLGVRTIFDLRSKKEVDDRGQTALRNINSIGQVDGAVDETDGDPVQVEQGESGNDDERLARRVFVPAFPNQDASPEGIAKRYLAYTTGSAEGFTSAYHDILSSAGPSYRTILLHLRDHPTSPIIVHCTAGKDRTGIIIALILKLAGVEDEIVAREYQLTEVGLGPMREEIVLHLLGSTAVGGERKKAESMIGARKEYMLSTLAMLRDQFGGAENYVKTYCGLNDDDVRRIRGGLIVPAAPIHYKNGV